MHTRAPGKGKNRIVRWIRRLAFILAVVVIALAVYLRPYHQQAQSYDLSLIPQANALPLEGVPSHVVGAILATEDVRFYEHHGLDVRGICRAAVANVRGKGPKQGGSTITQQLAKQTYGILKRTMERKFVEGFLARRIEKTYSKDTILSNYLTIIYMGNGYHGLAEAALGYFGKPVSELTVEEAATLAGIIKAPSALEPIGHPERARQARNLVLRRMAAEGYLPSEDVDALCDTPIHLARDHV